MAEVWIIENSNEYKFPASAIAKELGLTSYLDEEIAVMDSCEANAEVSAD